MWNHLHGNNSALETTIVRVNNLHIRLIMPDTLYATISPMTYAVPDDLGLTTTVSLKATTS